ncbi:MAG: acetate--CoA ligase family protein [Sphingomonas sp.]
MGKGLQALLDDPNIGSVVVAITRAGRSSRCAISTGSSRRWTMRPSRSRWRSWATARRSSTNSWSASGPGEWCCRARPSARLRAMAALTAHGAALAGRSAPTAFPRLRRTARRRCRSRNSPPSASLGALGIAVPEGALAPSPAEAMEAADRIGYPVALKAQSAALLHKTDAGGVALGLTDRDAVAEAWNRVAGAIAGGRPDVALDGMLLERMAEPGLDMIVLGPARSGLGGGHAGRRRRHLGRGAPGLRLLPAGLAESDILDELDRLRAAPLLHGMRGAAPLDRAAVAAAVRADRPGDGAGPGDRRDRDQPLAGLSVRRRRARRADAGHRPLWSGIGLSRSVPRRRPEASRKRFRTAGRGRPRDAGPDPGERAGGDPRRP